MIIHLRVEDVPPFTFEHPKRLQDRPSLHPLENPDVHLAVVKRGTGGEWKQGASSLAVLHQKKREVVGHRRSIDGQRRASLAIAEDGKKNADIVANGPHPTHFFSLDIGINAQPPRHEVVAVSNDAFTFVAR